MQSKIYRRYFLILLTVILAFNFVDRRALGIVLQDIKVELSSSDTQLGFLSGFAFALFYAVMGHSDRCVGRSRQSHQDH